MADVIPAGAVSVQAASALFEENGAGTYTATFRLPPNATLIDVIVENIALWTAGTSASLEVGSTDPDGYFTAVDLKATDLLAGESVSLMSTQVRGGVIGAYDTGTSTHLTRLFSSAARTIVATIVAAGTDATAGRTRVTVVHTAGSPTVITQ